MLLDPGSWYHLPKQTYATKNACDRCTYSIRVPTRHCEEGVFGLPHECAPHLDRAAYRGCFGLGLQEANPRVRILGNSSDFPHWDASVTNEFCRPETCGDRRVLHSVYPRTSKQRPIYMVAHPFGDRLCQSIFSASKNVAQRFQVALLMPIMRSMRSTELMQTVVVPV